MNAQEAVRQQLGFWHGVGGGVVGDCGEAINAASRPVSAGAAGVRIGFVIGTRSVRLCTTVGWPAKMGRA